MRATYMHVADFPTPQNANLDLSYIPGLGVQAIPGVPTVTITNITTRWSKARRIGSNVPMGGQRDEDPRFPYV